MEMYDPRRGRIMRHQTRAFAIIVLLPLHSSCAFDDVGYVPAPDLTLPLVVDDLSFTIVPDGLSQKPSCTDGDGGCLHWIADPAMSIPFPPGAVSYHVKSDANGAPVLDEQFSYLHFIWIPQDTADTVSKIDSRTLREVARYPSVTCHSNPTGSLQACDGQNGCCAADSDPEWQARRLQQPSPGRQGIKLGNNGPSRTAIDFNGDLLVANRAAAGIASVTKIANDIGGCLDRNHNGKIDTSKDANNDGRIDPNDPREYLGQDDECVVWTTNHGTPNAQGDAVGLDASAVAAPSDAFAGEYTTGKFFRIDGASGKVRTACSRPTAPPS
jgi:hypothetical protein